MRLPVIMFLMFTIFLPHTANSKENGEQFHGENLLYKIPSGWVVGNSARSGKYGIKEFILSDQKILNWDELITVQIFYGGIAKSAEEFNQKLGQAWKSACPDSLVRPAINQIENGYKSLFWQQYCANNPNTGKPEITYFKAIEGNDNFYVVQKAWKRAPSKEEVVKWARFLRESYVCDSRLAKQKCPILK